MWTDPQAIKAELLAHCQAYVSKLLMEASDGIHRSREAANQEEKSSAGDKFETQRAMMHLQMESFIERLEVARRLETELMSLKLQSRSAVELGALIQTDSGIYFIAVSAPSIELGSVAYTCLSREAPLYLAMQGLAEGDWFEWGEEGEESAILRIS